MQTGGSQSGGGGGLAGATYKSFRRSVGQNALGDINVTPLVDVVLVLLLVFMITAPMMNRGIDVALPVASQPQISPEDRVSVTVRADQRIYVGDQLVPSLDLLEDKLHTMAGEGVKVVYLKGDEGLRYGKIIEVVDRIKRAGIEQVGFVYVLPQEKASR
jgi:biopolymer transport protein TolR